MTHFILASASPRRIALFKSWGVDFVSIPAAINEQVIERESAGLPPRELARDLAKAKALDVSRSEKLKVKSINSLDPFVLGVDTLVALGDEVLGKPQDADDAFRILKKLQGVEQTVFSGLAIAQAGEIVASDVCASIVKMKSVSDEDIWRYIEEEKPFDKAGAYAIQEGAHEFVEYYEGCYNNIVGMPLCTLYDLVRGKNLAILLPDSVPDGCLDHGRVYL